MTILFIITEETDGCMAIFLILALALTCHETKNTILDETMEGKQLMGLQNVYQLWNW